MHEYDYDTPAEVAHEAESEAMRGQSLEQIDRAREWLLQDPLRWVRIPWDTIHDACGPLHPGSYWLVGAYTGGGKSTLLANILMHYAARGTRTYYLPLEQTPELVRVMWAGMACGYDPNAVAQLQWGKLPIAAKQAVSDHMAWQESDACRDTVFFDEVTNPGVAELWAAIRRAGRQGYQVLVIDHFGRLNANRYQDTVALAQTLKEGAKQYGIALLVAGQLNRGDGRNPLRMFLPPTIEDLKGGNVLVEEADVALGLFRPLLDNISKADMLQLKVGLKDVAPFTKPGCLGVRVLKHRFGSNTGRTYTLAFKDGRITDPATERRESWETRHDL